MNKLLSGKWLLTVMCGIVFMILALEKYLPAAAVCTILYKVIDDYFKKEDK